MCKIKIYVQLVIVALIAFLGLVTHAFIASSAVAEEAATLGASIGIVSESVPERTVPIHIMDSQVLHAPGDGVYNYRLDILNDRGERVARVHPLLSAVVLALAPNREVWGVFMPFPFLIPFVIHITLVWLVPVVVGWVGNRTRIYEITRAFGSHAVISAAYAYFIMAMFQSTRMFWGGRMWGAGLYLNSHRYGWESLYLLVSIWVLIYFYCLFGTAGIRARSRDARIKQDCPSCGYACDDASNRCPECGHERGRAAKTTLRIKPTLLTAMCVVAFFSPALMASIYTLLGA